MHHEAVFLYDGTGNFVGYAVRKSGTAKLVGSNIYSEAERGDLLDHLAELNRGADLREYWPDARDPEVLALTDDPKWHPVEMEPVEVVDEENSVYAYVEQPDELTGEMGRLDPDNSILVYKTIMAPRNPSDVIARQREAAEIIAKKRAGVE